MPGTRDLSFRNQHTREYASWVRQGEEDSMFASRYPDVDFPRLGHLLREYPEVIEQEILRLERSHETPRSVPRTEPPVSQGPSQRVPTPSPSDLEDAPTRPPTRSAPPVPDVDPDESDDGPATTIIDVEDRLRAFDTEFQLALSELGYTGFSAYYGEPKKDEVQIANEGTDRDFVLRIGFNAKVADGFHVAAAYFEPDGPVQIVEKDGVLKAPTGVSFVAVRAAERAQYSGTLGLLHACRVVINGVAIRRRYALDGTVRGDKRALFIQAAQHLGLVTEDGQIPRGPGETLPRSGADLGGGRSVTFSRSGFHPLYPKGEVLTVAEYRDGELDKVIQWDVNSAGRLGEAFFMVVGGVPMAVEQAMDAGLEEAWLDTFIERAGARSAVVLPVAPKAPSFRAPGQPRAPGPQRTLDEIEKTVTQLAPQVSEVLRQLGYVGYHALTPERTADHIIVEWHKHRDQDPRKAVWARFITRLRPAGERIEVQAEYRRGEGVGHRVPGPNRALDVLDEDNLLDLDWVLGPVMRAVPLSEERCVVSFASRRGGKLRAEAMHSRDRSRDAEARQIADRVHFEPESGKVVLAFERKFGPKVPVGPATFYVLEDPEAEEEDSPKYGLVIERKGMFQLVGVTYGNRVDIYPDGQPFLGYLPSDVWVRVVKAESCSRSESVLPSGKPKREYERKIDTEQSGKIKSIDVDERITMTEARRNRRAFRTRSVDVRPEFLYAAHPGYADDPGYDRRASSEKCGCRITKHDRGED